MEDQAAQLLATLKKTSVAVDAKLTQFNNLKSSIKHQRVPDAAQAPIFQCLRIAIGSQTSTNLVSAGFSTLSHIIKRLNLQDQTAIISSQCDKLLPLLQDRLGDARESHRIAASQALVDLWPYSHEKVEQVIRDGALVGTNARAKETAMTWLLKMHSSESLPFKSFVPSLVASLEDADGMVRETAKSTVVELFRDAPERAKTDLKKQLTAHNVRKTIATFIISQLDLPATTADVDLKASTAFSASAMTLNPDRGFADSLALDSAPPVETVPMDPIYVYTQRELEDVFREMHPHFEGKETEHNWLPRDKSITKLRRINKGNAATEFFTPFRDGIKSLLDGILKVANSLRTTMSSNGCQLVQELARSLGTALDPMVEILLQSFIKMCAATKNIAAQNGNVTVDAIFSNASYSARIMQHVWFAVGDKNVQPRSFASGWLKTLIRRYGQHKSQLEHSGGLQTLIDCIKKGLADANPKVREGFRSTYWLFARVWPDKAEGIMDSLDPKAQGLLRKDPNNPNATAPASMSASVGAGSSRLKPAPSSKSLKETIAAQKKARLAARGQPERPSSAMSAFSPVKSSSSHALHDHKPSNLSRSTTSRPPSAMSSGRPDAEHSAKKPGGSLMAAPVRRPRRQEPPRPKTADPYASRNRDTKVATPAMSPINSPERTVTKKAGTIGKNSGSRITSRNSPMMSPERSKSRMEHIAHHQTRTVDSPAIRSPTLTPSKAEDLTMVMPFRERTAVDKTASDANVSSVLEEDGFTMIVPSMSMSLTEHSRPGDSGSPTKIPSPRPRSMNFDLNDSVGSLRPMGLERSPKPRPQERASTEPLANEEVKVYEDPVIGQDGDVPVPSENEKPVLEELTVNAQAREHNTNGEEVEGEEHADSANEQPPRGHVKTPSISGLNGSININGEVTQDPAYVLRTHRLLVSGIERIRARTLDVHGFRRLQDLVKNNLEADIWGEDAARFGDLLLALLDYLESPMDLGKTANVKAQNIKAQVLATVRAMLVLHRKLAAPYYARGLCAILCARSQWDSASHISSDLEKTTEDIVKYGQVSECINAILDLLSAPPGSATPTSPAAPASPPSSDKSRPSSSAVSSRTTTLALNTLSSLLQATQTRDVPVSEEQASKLGRLAVKNLVSLDPDVRRADMDFCVQLHESLGGEEKEGGEKGDGFWKAVKGADRGHLNLITYYLARKGRP
ncbi:hypothetical protein K490DRAFT_36968 [Saccharata proteae CBS 121410]|uniref:TOG domain-containing protein n=1 Tax=Saccharata proteae CBS 121410 TaxID=1314787 RepID=A0A6A5YFK4_9PEZI|nr:hypothetical protein K490DRAFT_36968 [Saccharata proteae CBS 121410]